MSGLTVDLRGMYALIRVMDPDETRERMARALLAETHALLDEPGLRNYPPTNEANTPGRFSTRTRRPMGYYVRGSGWMYPIMQRATLGRKDVTIRGAFRRAGLTMSRGRMPGTVAGYRLRPTSEQYGAGWQVTVGGSGSVTSVKITNRVSYARFVGGNQQAGFHAARGWRKFADVVAERGPGLVEAIMKTVSEGLSRLVR